MIRALLRGNTLMLASAAILGLLVAALAGASWFTGASPLAVDLTAVTQGATAHHWLGTDDLGRDVLARLAAGVRLSLTVALAVLGLTAVIGVPLGLLGGWYGGKVDAALTKATEIVLSFPGILLALALAALLGPGVGNVVVALGLLGWVGFCRLTRVQVQTLKNQPFVWAAQLGGVGQGVIWARHILPLCAGPLLVEALLVASGAMVAEAGLSFLGLGVPAPQPSLGGMLRDGMRTLLTSPHLVVVPAVVLMCLTLCLNMFATGLRRKFGHGMEGA
jgi:peptide/nickel transport system permease protein